MTTEAITARKKISVEIRNVLSRSRTGISRATTQAYGVERDSGGGHRATSRKISARDGVTGPNARTGPRATASRSTLRSSAPSARSKTARGAVEVDDGRRRAGRAASRRRRRRRARTAGGRRSAAELARLPAARIAPVGDDHQVVAEPLDQLELVAGEQHRHAAPRPARAARRPRCRRRSGRGRRTARRGPAASGSCTSAAAIWARCWLPSDSFSSGSSARSPSPSRSSSARRCCAGAVARSGRAAGRGRRAGRRRFIFG